MTILTTAQVANADAGKFTQIEVNAFYNDDHGPGTLHKVRLDGDVNLSFENDGQMEKFFQWIADKLEVEVEIVLIKETWEQLQNWYSPQ